MPFESMDSVWIGSSPVMTSVLQALCKAARFDKIVLLLGETGTGKDLAARRIHELSPRRALPFVAINCSNLSEALFESELFGHAKGAFTGAIREKSGLLDIAQNGTVFMDEIGELPLGLQAKLLRLLDKKESRKLGATLTKVIRARFIFATNRDLYGYVLDGRFRKDLYYRINVVKIMIPALRDRKEDLPALANHFLEVESLRTGSSKALTEAALEKLLAHNFPGNVRELENIIQRACVFSEDSHIRAEDIRFDREPEPGMVGITRSMVERVLEECRWNKTRAATKLGKSRRQLYRLLDRYRTDDLLKKPQP